MSGHSWFNAQLLKSLRRQLNWTQVELAEYSQLSIRVIAKAEAGKRVSASTIQALVRTLNEAGKEVSCSDFCYDPRDIVQTVIYDCVHSRTGSIEAWHGMLAENIEINMDGDPVSNPLAGRYQGIAGLKALHHKITGIFVRDSGTLGDMTQMRLVDNEVLAWGHEYLRVPEAPPSLPTFVMLQMRFKNRRITQINAYYEAAGLMSRVANWAKAYPKAPWTNFFNLESFFRYQQPVAPIRQMVLNSDKTSQTNSSGCVREGA